MAGIFTTRDPFPGVATLPVTLQPYLYAAGNPLRYTDPSGRFIFLPLLAVAAVGGLIGGVGYYALKMYFNHDPCARWDWKNAVFWGGVGTGIGALLGVGIYGGWWAGAQLGWWGAASGGTAAAQQIVTRGGAGPVRIGQAGVQHAIGLLKQAGEPIIRQQAYYRTSLGRAFIDIETQKFLIEVKNLANPTLSRAFRNQVLKYLEVAGQVGKPLHYYFTNQPPNESIIQFLEDLNIIWFHVPNL